MLRFQTHTLMREYSTTDQFGVGTPAIFMNGTTGIHSVAIWLKAKENIAIQGGPAFLYHSSTVPDGSTMYDENGTGAVGGLGCIGGYAYNGTLDASTTNYYLWVQVRGLSSASLLMSADTLVDDKFWPSTTDGTWDNFTADRANVDATATTYFWNIPPYGFTLAIDTTSTMVVPAGDCMFLSPWAAGIFTV